MVESKRGGGRPSKRARTESAPRGINEKEDQDDDSEASQSDDTDYKPEADARSENEAPAPPTDRIDIDMITGRPIREQETSHAPFHFLNANYVQEVDITDDKVTMLIGKTVNETIGAKV